MKRTFLLGALLAPATLLADFSYTTTTKFTGGAMAGMSRALGGFSKNMRKLTDGMVQTVALKGGRMATFDDETSTIVDLEKETYTHIDFRRKSYSVITFAEMEEAMKRAMEKARGKAREQDPNADLNFKLDIKETGQKKTIAGMNAREVIMLIQAVVQDKKSSQSGAMDVMNAIWVADASTVPGYEELEAFNKKAGAKMAKALSGGGGFAAMPMMDPKMADAMRKAAEEGRKLEGVHVLMVTKIGTQLDPATASQISNPNDTPQGPTAGEAASGAAAGAAEETAINKIGKIGGLGGFGGFGRNKRKKEAEPAPAPPPAAAQNQASGQGVLMETVTEMGNFSNAPVDSARFEVPAGFKETEHEMKKLLR